LREKTVRDLRFFDDDDRMKTMIGLTEFALKAMTLSAHPTMRQTSHDEELKEASEQSRRRFLKTLVAISRCRIAEDNGSRDLLSRSSMHIDEQNEIALAVQQRRRQKHRCVGSWLFVVTSSVVVARIYREDPLRLTASHNRLDLSLSKRIRHGLIAK
jgi:hypothetical protein